MANKTRIAFVAVPCLLIAMLVFAPKIIGLGIRDLTINELVALVPPESEGQISFNETNFDSGWFSTTATLNANYSPFGTESLAVNFNFAIQHGPLLFTASGPKLGMAYAQITPSSEDGLPLLAPEDSIPLPNTIIEMFAGFDQSFLISLKVDPVSSVSDAGSVGLQFEGLNASLIANADQSADMSLTMGALAVTESTSGLDLKIDGLNIQSHSSQLNDVLAPSSASLEIPSIKSNAPFSIEMTDLSVSSELMGSANPEAVRMSQHIAVPKISGDLPLESFEWTIEVDELQRRLVSDYYSLIGSLQNQSASDPEAAARSINLISQQLTQLFVNNPLIIKNDLNAQVYGGSHSAEIEFNWAGLPLLNNIARLDLNEGLAALGFSVEVSLDATAIGASPIADQVNAYMQEGYIVLENGRMLITATLEDSMLLLNGEEIPIQNFF